MKRKTILRILAAVTMAAAMTTTIAFVGCSKEEPVEPPQNEQTNNNGNNNNNPSNPSNPSNPNTPSTPGDTETKTVTVVDTLAGIPEGYTAQGGTLTAAKDGESFTLAQPTAPTAPAGYKFDGYYSDEALTQKITFPYTVTDDTTIYMGWWETVEDTSWANVAASLQPTNGGSGAKFTGTAGRFGFDGVYFEYNNTHFKDAYDMNMQKNSMYFTLNGGTNSVSFTSYQATGIVLRQIELGDDGHSVKSVIADNVKTDTSNTSTGQAGAVTWTDLPAGSYEFDGVTSCRVGNFVIKEDLRPAKENGIAIDTSAAKLNFIKGETFSSEGLAVYKTFANGARRQMYTGFTVSAVDLSTKGAKTVTVTCDGHSDWTQTYTVESIEIEKIEIADSSLNDFAPVVYYKGDAFESSAISVNVSGKASDGETVVTFYDVANTFYDMTATDTATAGAKTLTVKFKDGTTVSDTITDTFEYYVIETLPETTKVVTVTVDPELADEGGVNTSTTTVKTIRQALSYIKAMNLGDDVIKNVKLTAGKTYNEKVIIDIPNVVLFAEDTQKATEAVGAQKTGDSEGTTDYKLTTKIWFNGINGGLEVSGKNWANDKVENTNATVVVSADNVTIRNIVIENYYNDYQKADAHAGEDQALALLVEGDKFIMENCALSSYQDTVKFNSGRQLILDSYIEGVTDFIYGETNTTYFYNCVIFSKYRNHATEGGYITAFKGGSKDADHVEYGAIFDNCEFKADEREVKKAATAIARPWGVYSAVTVMNSTLGGHISKAGWDGKSTAGNRYVSMSGNAPTLATVKFYEYNNTGDGALVSGTDAEVAGMHYLTDEQAAKYNLYSNSDHTINGSAEIFKAASNQTLTNKYTDDWQGTPFENVLITIKNETGEEVGKLVVAKGAKVTEAQLKAVTTAPESQEVDGYFQEQACSTAFVFTTAISADTDIFVKFKAYVAPASVTHTLTVPASGEWSTNTVLTTDDSFFTVIANNESKATKIENAKAANTSYTKNSKNLTFSQQFSLTSGKLASATSGFGLGFTIPAGKTAKVTVYAAAANTKTAVKLAVFNGDSAQAVTDLKIDGVAKSDFENLPETPASAEGATSVVVEYEFKIAASGTIGIGGNGGGAYIYGLTVEIIG